MPASKPSQYQIRLWALLLKRQTRALTAIETALSAQRLIPLTWYDALYALYTSKEPLTLRQVSDRILLSKSALTRSVDKLLEQALVRKIPSPLDGRAFHLSVTPKGMKAMRDCWAVYRNGIRDFFGEAAEEDDVAAVLKNLEKWGQL